MVISVRAGYHDLYPMSAMVVRALRGGILATHGIRSELRRENRVPRLPRVLSPRHDGGCREFHDHFARLELSCSDCAVG